jgi:hypothetical protein
MGAEPLRPMSTRSSTGTRGFLADVSRVQACWDEGALDLNLEAQIQKIARNQL